MFATLRRIWIQLSHWALPHRCILCGKEVSWDVSPAVCATCEEEASWADLRCGRCGSVTYDGDCRSCADSVPVQDSLQSLGPYRGSLRQAIIDAKYNGDELSRRWLRRKAEAFIFPPESVLSYVPSHPKRLKERRLKKQHLPDMLEGWQHQLHFQDLLQRTRYERAQVTMGAQARRRLPSDSFKATLPSPPPKEVVLIDDVWTTGSTALAAVKALKRAGVRYVHVRVLAMVPPEELND